MRAFAAIAVMLFHFISFWNGEDHVVQNESVRDASKFGAQGVELFFIISGFVIVYSFQLRNYKIKHYGKYLLKRILRIIPVYWSAIAAILLVANLWSEGLGWDWNNIAANMFFLVDAFEGCTWVNEIFNTLGVEFQFYLIIGLLYPLIQKNLFIRYGTLILWLTAGILTKDHYSFLVNAPYFITGIILLDIYQNGLKTHTQIALAVIVAVLGFLYEPADLLITLFAILCFLWIRPNWSFTNWVGNSSYSLYLTHGLFGGWFLFFGTRSEYLGWNEWWMIPIACVISILSAYAFYWVFERLAIKVSRRIKYV